MITMDPAENPDIEMSRAPSNSPVGRVESTINIARRDQNPFTNLSATTIAAGAQEFASEHGLMDIAALLVKGALVSANPKNLNGIPLLTDRDREILNYEATHKWSHPLALYITIIVCSIGACVQGWDQTGSNGAVLSFPREFGIGDGDDPTSPNWERHNLLVGLVNAGPYIGSAFLGCWLSDPINHYLGRRGTIFISAIFVFLTPIGGGFTRTWEELLATRLLMGIGMGLKGAVVPVFAAENSPTLIRGALVMSWQMWTAFGIFLGFCANLTVYKIEKIAWRLQIGSACIPAIPLLLGVYFCPESPRWYIKKGRLRDAYNSLRRLRHHDLQAARDLYYMYVQIKNEEEIVGKVSYPKRFGELFMVPRVRRATLASFVVMIAQQMSGINIIAFYSSTVFVEGGASEKNALTASLGFGLVNFLFAWPAVWSIDTYGRRSLLLFTFPNMAWTLLAAGLGFLIPKTNPAHLGLIATFIYIFAAFYSVGEGPVPFTYAAEVFPLSHRELGMGFAVATCLFWAAVLSMTFPLLLAKFTPTGAFGFYAGLNVCALILIFLFVPETKQRTLEEMDWIFAVPTGDFIKWNTEKAIPYWVGKNIMKKKDMELEPLYRFNDNKNGSNTEGGRAENDV